ncbi:uncharacterized protein LOC116295608 isoform X3 [Actinia tenebrosa]|uniref:Uncharacterized protein LOC116295608 isoform X3 n=1 Tax=Actinia tenebrosa TaxID=6105 RepID=A0A6P8HVD9_ACTTE|nr:uncharacterized protein LOC116295608 isoform X3 [Actinia tenebrosa]
MTAMKFFIVASIVYGLVSSAIAWDFIIERNSTNKLTNSVVDSIDKFNISECSSSDDACTKFRGQKLVDRCQCVCNQGKSTFGFYNNQWGCTDNSIVQQHAACEYTLERPGSKGDHDPLLTLPILGPHNDNNYVGNIPSDKSCKVIAANATFLECDGSWVKLIGSNLKSKLAFQYNKTGTVYVGPYQPSSAADPSLDGRVIKIAIKCEGLTWTPSQCVTFKIKGQLTCSPRNNPPINPNEPTATPPPSTTTVTNGTGINIKKSQSDDTTPAAALIAGSVVGGIAFVMLIVVIVVLIIYWKRRKAKAKEKSVRRAQGNLAYEQGPDPFIPLTRPTSFRPLPQPPPNLTYDYLERGSSTIQRPNSVIPVSPGPGAYDHCNGEPLYGEIDETYSTLNHQPLPPTRSINSDFRFTNVPASGFSPEATNKSSTLISSDGSGSGIGRFEEHYDVAGGQIQCSLPRENNLNPGGSNSLDRETNVSYDVPGSVIRRSSKERPKNSIQDNATVPSNVMQQPSQRDILQREAYETVWDDEDDNLVARIDLS